MRKRLPLVARAAEPFLAEGNQALTNPRSFGRFLATVPTEIEVNANSHEHGFPNAIVIAILTISKRISTPKGPPHIN
jgi:hypothetical protein